MNVTSRKYNRTTCANCVMQPTAKCLRNIRAATVCTGVEAHSGNDTPHGFTHASFTCCKRKRAIFLLQANSFKQRASSEGVLKTANPAPSLEAMSLMRKGVQHTGRYCSNILSCVELPMLPHTLSCSQRPLLCRRRSAAQVISSKQLPRLRTYRTKFVFHTSM